MGKDLGEQFHCRPGYDEIVAPVFDPHVDLVRAIRVLGQIGTDKIKGDIGRSDRFWIGLDRFQDS